MEIDPARRVRIRGYTIIQPRIWIALPAATATRFTRIFADATGTDPYCRTVSDAQQDLFLEAIFHGKAIYDVKAFHAILEDRFPAETVLSHDLIEGAHVGVGLASDIELFENLPTDYGELRQRQHRWIRGDWQIAPWVLGRVPGAAGEPEPNPLTPINRWRILDNLRRSLVPVAALLLLLLGWLISAAPGVWSLVVGFAVAIPAAGAAAGAAGAPGAGFGARLAGRGRRTRARRRDDCVSAASGLAGRGRDRACRLPAPHQSPQPARMADGGAGADSGAPSHGSATFAADAGDLRFVRGAGAGACV